MFICHLPIANAICMLCSIAAMVPPGPSQPAEVLQGLLGPGGGLQGAEEPPGGEEPPAPEEPQAQEELEAGEAQEEAGVEGGGSQPHPHPPTRSTHPCQRQRQGQESLG